MGIITEIEIRNFKCFRPSISFKLNKATYIVGSNNAGKSAIINALKCFFNENCFDETLLNKTEFGAKKAGYNRADITLAFDLKLANGKARKKRLDKKYGHSVKITKSFTFREKSQTIHTEYKILGKASNFDSLDNDIQDILNAVSISYIHPQEGQALLQEAQYKFKKRLFANWGRHKTVTKELQQLQKQWDKLKEVADGYLSASLTSNIKSMWPPASVTVNLPETIEEIVSVSNISFKNSTISPDIPLTSQGTGVQSTILYHTHFILDNDRSLHRGMYFPIWLLEEPESFLHADIASKLGAQLSSDTWLQNIQMLVSTHSPIILATTSQNKDHINWLCLDEYKQKFNVPVADVTPDVVSSIGKLMGDANFDVYFSTSSYQANIFLEDKRKLTKTKFEEAGILITKSLEGVGEVDRYITVYESVPAILSSTTVFIVDNDQGFKNVRKYCPTTKIDKRNDGYVRYKLQDSIYIISTPDETSIEDLFNEFEGFLETKVFEIWESDFTKRKSIPTDLSRAVAKIRGKDDPTSLKMAKDYIRKTQDVKDLFWKYIDVNNLSFSDRSIKALKKMLTF